MMDEMIQDTMAFMDDDGVEEEAEEEVQKVLFEMTDGLLGQAGAVGDHPLEASFFIFFLTLVF
jgi:charged multivesicular body protein 3